MKRTLAYSLAATLLLGLIAAVSFADVAPPNSFGCNNAEAGDACQTDENKRGVCVSETCSGLDDSNLEDGGVPKSKEYPCLICSEDAADGGCAAVPYRSRSSNLIRLLTLLFE